MKKTTYLYLAFLFGVLINLSIQAQTNPNEILNETQEINKHELRLNAFYLLLGAFEVNYEYLLNDSSGIGISGMYRYDDDFWEYKSNITGSYRHYFGKKYAAGFYGEAFAMYNTIEDYYDIYYSDFSYGYREETSHNFGVGFAFGAKLISKNNLLLDFGAGIARNIFSSDDENWIVPRFNISFGYRF